jgi:hypothetical protein
MSGYAHVRNGSWPCKNTAQQTAEKSIPSKARSGSVRSIPNYGAAASEKQILCPLRDFTFSHSQGQSRHFGRRPTTSGLPL